MDAGARQTKVADESIQALAGSVTEAAAMESIKQASTQNVASAKQLETAARNLNDLGQRLTQMVERYKI